MRKLVTALVICTTLAACTQTGSTQPGQFGMNNTTGGTLLGAGAGALLGNQFGRGSGRVGMTVLGALAGGLIGHSVGQSLDAADRAAMSQTTQTALETSQPNQPLPWRNQESGHYGTVVPGSYYRTPEGQYCREFQQTVNIGGEAQQAYGKACRQPDGSWRIVQ
jgi:surface antigen